MAAAVAAHHGGLANVKGAEAGGVPVRGSLAELVASRAAEYAGLRTLLPPSARDRPLPVLPAYLDRPGDALLRVELFTRFLFSALVDAEGKGQFATNMREVCAKQTMSIRKILDSACKNCTRNVSVCLSRRCGRFGVSAKGIWT